MTTGSGGAWLGASRCLHGVTSVEHERNTTHLRLAMDALKAERPRPCTFGPFTQRCSFDGMLIRVGGNGDTVPVHLQDGDKLHVCNAGREMARRLAPHLYQGTLRVWGVGRWKREPNGHWRLIRFDIDKFELLDDSPLGEIVEKLRKVEGSGWRKFDDPLAELMSLRDS